MSKLGNTCWNETEVTHKTWIENNKANQYKIRCPIGCQVYSQFVGIIRCLQSVNISSSVYNDNVRFQFVIYYVSEHQLPPVIDASHTTPTTRVNQGPKLLKFVKETLSVL